MLQEALDIAAAAATTTGELFYFFDFDRTLSLQEGFEEETPLDAIVGEPERRRLMRLLLGSRLAARRCWVLTANRAIERIAAYLNEVLLSGEGDDVLASDSSCANRDPWTNPGAPRPQMLFEAGHPCPR